MSLTSPEIAFSMDARRVWPPGRRVRPSKVWLAVARPAGATRREDGTGVTGPRGGRGGPGGGQGGGRRQGRGGGREYGSQAHGATVGAVGDGREAGRGQLAARSLWMTFATPWMVEMP